MYRGWEVLLDDGTYIREGDAEWKDVPKNEIKKLSLLYDSRKWDLSGKQSYFVRTSASMVPGIVESLVIEKRCIGYYEGAKKVYYIINEFTGKFHMEVIDNGAK